MALMANRIYSGSQMLWHLQNLRVTFLSKLVQYTKTNIQITATIQPNTI